MSDPLATYSFLPWLRRGMASQVARDEAAGIPAVAVPRASIDVGITFNNDAALSATVTLALNGPGEAIGVDPRVVSRVVPQRDVHDAEPNFFPFVELSEADLPWRYTPATASAAQRLTPWFSLICLADAEIVDYQAAGSDRDLAVVTVSDATALPPWDQLWAWSHVQVSGVTNVTPAAADAIMTNEPSRIVARMMCPRRLDAKTRYRAFLVPSFARGRLAGLGEDVPATVDALAPSWDSRAADLRLPVYYEWPFETGVQEDFEYLVRQLRPFRVPKEVGIRDMGVAAPGMGLPPAASTPLGLEGALRAEDTATTPWPAGERGTFVTALRRLLNLPADALQGGTLSPVVAPPLYVRWHAARKTLAAPEPSPWFGDLNTDPRLRVSAGLGTQVVQAQQRPLMASAWQQVKRIREINEELRLKQLARMGAQRIHDRVIALLDAESLLRAAAPVLAQMRGSPLTIAAMIRKSPIARGALEAQLRRIARPLGPVGRRQGRLLRPDPPSLLARMNRGQLTPAPLPAAPSGMFTPARDGPSLLPQWVRPWMRRLARILPRWLLLAAVVMLLVALIALATARPALTPAALIIGAMALGAAIILRRLDRQWQPLVGIRDGTLAPDHVRVTPARPSFVAREVPLGLGPSDAPLPPTGAPTGGSGSDSPSGVAFRQAAVAMLARATIPPATVPPLEPVNITALATTVVASLQPAMTIERSVAARLRTAPGIVWSPTDPLQEVMAAPEFPEPMYEPLRDLGQDWLLPGLEKVPQNTTSLLITNQRFIEAYMAGLSHEMARELLWNEYPTDQRGTYFRQFWDVSAYVPPPGETVDPETLRDIKPIHQWPPGAALGANTSRRPPPGGAHLVLLVRGELLRRYPNTLVYAVKAQRAGGQRQLGTEERHPVFRGTLKPDVTFFGFELTADDARGSTGRFGPAGWFFVLQEQPSEPRFGLDIAETFGGQPATWDAMSWGSLAADAAALNAITHIDLTNALPDTSLAEQSAVDVVWRAAGGPRSSRASDLAYITLQVPVRIAIHGARMLPPG